ncbi:type II toxin-antitoxin system VapB family antitoxin [Phyllobacterium zundukense]|uniref:Histidinol dehydrogenase n=1 Tax=Phyllobacterium zundukense TaxID=1867719 RepID=A0A2N9VR20_9HYPH|nr:type II toxin-antitoxin system VapB family antitoxin [Phyllobacterium zundukense]ATU92369.1 histidinol dehydrogenase [Phyllobacterium zundukense]PIO41938.1 histidinol dehydrogenase [Phyllobacterium zundukense]
MALYVRDSEVDALATEIQRLTKAKTKTEVVRNALKHELKLVRQAMPAKDRFAKSKAMAAAIGEDDPDFDMKTYLDEMWEM